MVVMQLIFSSQTRCAQKLAQECAVVTILQLQDAVLSISLIMQFV